MPVVLIEAMAAGKPIIATRTKGVEEMITDQMNGLLVNEKDPKQIAEKIIQLHDGKELCDKISQNAKRSSEQYDWDINYCRNHACRR